MDEDVQKEFSQVWERLRLLESEVLRLSSITVSDGQGTFKLGDE